MLHPMENKGILLVVSGPSGVGKGTVCKKILADNSNIVLSVSATTRKPRSEDTEGVTYYFKTPEEFRAMVENGEFLEWAVYNGNHYGTPAAPVQKQLSEGKDVLLEIDVQGALEVKKNFPQGLYVFIAPPDKSVLRERLKGRGTESEEEIERRVSEAERELSLSPQYDYTIINDDLSAAVTELERLIFEKKAHA